jgi:hypothetical protein
MFEVLLAMRVVVVHTSYKTICPMIALQMEWFMRFKAGIGLRIYTSVLK